MGGYGVNQEQFFVTTFVPSFNRDYTTIGDKLAVSELLDNSASDTSKDYTLTFNSGSYTKLYVSIDLGQITDGKTITLVYEISVTTVNYTSVSDIVANISNAVRLRKDTKNDDGTDTVTGVDWFSYNGTVCNNIYANGNSWIGLGSNSEHLKVNRRDAAMWNLWREEGTYSTGYNTYRFIRIRWSGYAAYNYTSASYLLTYDVILFDTGDIMLYMVDIPTSSYSGIFTLGSLSYTKPTTDSRYVTFYLQSDGSYLIDYAPINLYIKKYLIRDNNTLYNISDGVLTEIAGVLNSELFITSGIDTIPDGTLLMTLSNPEVLCWTDSDEVPSLTATVTALPLISQSIITNIDISDDTVLGIKEVTAEYEGNPTVLLSFDDKNTWYTFSDDNWYITTQTESGMTIDTLISITSEQ